jgi:hypothetical protein
VALLESGRVDEGFAQYEICARLAASADVHVEVAQEYLQRQRRSDALRHVRDAVRINPDHPVARQMLGILGGSER